MREAQQIAAADKAQTVEQVRMMNRSNNLQRSIRSIRAQVLKVEPDTLGCVQDFFAIGGNSLSAVRVLTSIKRTFNIKLDMTTILREPTVQSIARHIAQAGVSPDAPELDPSAVSAPPWSSLFSRT